jgi:hypothetical protein
MSDSEDFLKRWSRRKRQVAEAEGSSPEPARPERATPGDGEGEQEQDKQDKKEKKIAAVDPKNAAPETAFDLKSLPSIESITATTDIRGFLAPGVPVELTRAALRRAWVADPKIRDFIGIAENQWDFTKSGGVPGSDLLAPTGDIGRMVAQIFGEKSPTESPDQSLAAATKPLSIPDETGASAQQAEADPASHCIVNEQPTGKDRETDTIIAAEQKTISERVEDDAASQQDNEASDAPSTRVKRGHGGALPA